MKRFALPLSVFMVFVWSCARPSEQVLETETLFSLDIGILESDLNVFSFQNVSLPYQNHIAMRNGIFAISDTASGKIMEFSSYGDLLSLYYSPDENPIPITVRIQDPLNQRDEVVNKLAYPFPFQRIGNIAYSIENMILVQDTVTDSRKIYDEETGVYLNHIVLRFNEHGELQDYLGQEGIGGTAFPYIQSLRVTSRNHIVVTSKTPNSSPVFWFDERGDLLYAVEFETQHLPRYEREGWVPVLDTVYPHSEAPYILLKIDFHPQSSSESEADEDIVSRVYRFDIASGSYDSYFDLPINERLRAVVNEREQASVQYLYDFIGMDGTGTMFFISRLTGVQHHLLLVDSSGRVFFRGFIELNDSTIVSRDLRVSENGVLVGLLVFEDRADIVWWRTDRVIGDNR